ncbi:ATPase [Campylobacter jejuni]|nr:ATPase [Campylobacter jejuni]
MRGVKFKPMKSEHLLLRNLSIYGLGGMIAPFIGIKIYKTALQIKVI